MKASIVKEISSNSAFKFKSKIALDVLVDQMKYGESKEVIMPLLIKIIRAELNQYDMRDITEKLADSLTRQIIATLNANRLFADPEFIEIEQEILDRRDIQIKQNEV